MGLGEPPCTASGEPAFPVSDLAEQPRRGLPRGPAESDRVPHLILDHGLHPSVAAQTPHGLGMQHRTTLDLRATALPCRTFRPGVDDHGRAVRVGIGRDATRADRHERIGAAGGDVDPHLLTRHRGDPLGHPLDRLDDDRALRGR